MSAALLEAAATWSAPLAGPSPTGGPAVAEESYARLRAEIGKLAAVGGDQPAWQDVYALSVEILTQKSKDLLVASYLCGALLEREGVRGLLAGLTLYRDLITKYWDALYPERPRGRANAITWLVENAAGSLAQKSPSAGEAEALTASAALLEEIERVVGEKLGEAAPGLGALRQAVREAAAKAQSAAPRPAATTAATSAGAAAPAGPSEITSDAELRRALESAADTLRAAAAWRRKQSLADPQAYRLLRLGEWLLIDRAPPATDGKTLVAPPSTLKSRIEAAAGAQSWANVIEIAEKGLRGDGLFWLDLQRHVAQALRTLGPAHEEARKVVAQELGQKLGRFPGLSELKFRDGTPFADGPTRAWIEQEARPAAGGAAAAPPQPLVLPEATPRDLAAELEGALQQAQGRAAEGNLPEALDLLAKRGRIAESRREKFLWRLGQARLLALADRPELARAQLEGLDEELARVPVAEWDVAVSVDLVRALLECQRKIIKLGKATPEMLDRARQLYERLARLDPAAAIRAGGP